MFFRGLETMPRIEYRGNQRPTNGNLGSVGSMTFNEGIARVKEEVRDRIAGFGFSG